MMSQQIILPETRKLSETNSTVHFAAVTVWPLVAHVAVLNLSHRINPGVARNQFFNRREKINYAK